MAAQDGLGEQELRDRLRAQEQLVADLLQQQQQQQQQQGSAKLDRGAALGAAVTDAELSAAMAAAHDVESVEVALEVNDEALARQLQAELDQEASGLPQQHHPMGTSETDAQVAMMMQQFEIAQGMEAGDDAQEETLTLEDPVWGKLELAPGQRPSPTQIICFSLCPCLCIGRCCVKTPGGFYSCHPEKGARCLRFVLTLSVLLALVQVAMLAIAIALSDGLAPTEQNPMVGPYATILDRLGAKNAALIAYRNQWWRLFTPMLLHAGFIHLAVNVLIQVRIGVILEYQWGIAIYTIIYITSGFLSAILSCIALPDSLGVGSSGAIMGILGAWLAEIVCAWSSTPEEELGQRSANLVLVFLNILITLSFSLVPLVDWAAHIGGLLAGWMMGVVLFGHKFQSPIWRHGSRIVCLTGLVVFCVAGMVTIATTLDPSRDLLHVCREYREAVDDDDIPC